MPLEKAFCAVFTGYAIPSLMQINGRPDPTQGPFNPKPKDCFLAIRIWQVVVTPWKALNWRCSISVAD
jgi:hypothetical protein